MRLVFATPDEIGNDPDFLDIMVSAFNSTDGSLVWAKSLGSKGIETIGGIGTDPSNGSVYLSGGFYGSADFDPGRAGQRF